MCLTVSSTQDLILLAHTGHLDNLVNSRVKSPALPMKEISNNLGGGLLSADDGALNRRIFRSMSWAIGVAVIISLPFFSWRVTAGLLLGGLLSLLNHYWLNSSTTAAFSVIAHGAKPRLSLVHYLMRYAVLFLAVFVAYQVDVISLGATIAGLSSFVVALFVEAGREFYFAIIHREETI